MTSGYAQAHAGPDGANVLCMTTSPNRLREKRTLIAVLDSEEYLNKFRNDPEWYLKYRKAIEMEMSDYMSWHKNTPGSIAAHQVIQNETSEAAHRPTDLPHLVRAEGHESTIGITP